MKKRIAAVCLTVVLVLALAVPGLAVPREGSYILDDAGLLTQEEFELLEQAAQTLSESYNCGVYAVTVEDYRVYGSTPEKAANVIYQGQNFGLGDGQDGFLLLLSMAERDYWLMSCGDYGRFALNGYGRSVLEEKFLPYFGDDHWFGGFEAYLDESEDILQQAAAGTPVGGSGEDLEEENSRLFSYGIAAAVSAVVALIVCFSFKRAMKTAVIQSDADAYVQKNGVTITQRQDRYTHTTTVRQKIERDNGSSGGSSSGGSSGGSSGSGGKF